MRPLALTFGEPAGIGPDITLVAWRAREQRGVPPFYLLADADYLLQRAKVLGIDATIEVVDPKDTTAAFSRALPIVPIGSTVTASPGKPDRSSAPAAITSIEHAVDHVFSGACAAIVTNPVAKSVLYGSGFSDPGHTEFLAKLAQKHTGKRVRPVMMLWSADLAVVPVTIHIPLKDVPATLTTELIVETAKITTRELRDRFRVARPRLVISGLNPHAGEDGSLGDEEARLIMPAMDTLRASGIDVRGPLPADTMFHPAARKDYDVALCMYHDQALIPIKMLAFDSAVNVTLGLPFVRTSPDHGTAFDVAGTGRADPSSLIAALKLAARIAAASPALAK
jgi:4-hydroxythreonine-4-phosphate dehydrogenase